MEPTKTRRAKLTLGRLFAATLLGLIVPADRGRTYVKIPPPETLNGTHAWSRKMIMFD